MWMKPSGSCLWVSTILDSYLKEASAAYRKVLEQVPSHLDARLTLATVEKQMGNVDEALRVLSMGEYYTRLCNLWQVCLVKFLRRLS